MTESTVDAHRQYWDDFYSGAASARVPTKPSPYAEFVQEQLGGAPLKIVEVGFGTARDSFWFADRGHDVSGFDFSEAAVHNAQARSDSSGLGLRFHLLDLYDAAATQSVSNTTRADAVYGRFLIHSLEANGRANFLEMASVVLSDGGTLYLEFRTGRDEGARHVFGEDHFRTYLDPDQVVEEIKGYGGSIAAYVADYGLAVYKDEDPHVARITATW